MIIKIYFLFPFRIIKKNPTKPSMIKDGLLFLGVVILGDQIFGGNCFETGKKQLLNFWGQEF
jgi:hypothetical protein